MRLYWFISMGFALSCDVLTMANPEYCADSSECAVPLACDPILHRCLSTTAGDPILTAIEPGVGPTTGNIDITLTGQNFRPGTTVRFNDIDAPVTSITDGEIHVTLPPNPGACGKANVQVRSVEGSQTENGTLFRYKYGTLAFSAIANAPTVDINAKSITAARLDGDAINDLVVANSTSATLSVFRGVGDLTFTSKAAFAALFPVVSTRVADFDGDGISDILASSAGNFIFFQGQANLTYSQDNQYVYSNKQVEIGDFNNDQKPDLILLNTLQTQIDLYTNKDAFNFTAQTPTNPTGTTSAVAVGDWNGDHFLDFAVTDSVTGQVGVFLGRGDGTFAAGTGVATAAGASLLAATDLDGDGNLDLVIVTSGGQATLVAAFGRGDGTFQTTTLAIAANPRLLALADVDCDGQPEAIVYHQGTTQLSVYGNRGGNRGFAAPLPINTGAVIGAFVATPLDSDSQADIALLSAPAPATMVLLRNTSN